MTAEVEETWISCSANRFWAPAVPGTDGTQYGQAGLPAGELWSGGKTASLT